MIPFISYFQSIFTTSSPSSTDIEVVTHLIPHKVSLEMNSRLFAPYSREEIVIAVKQMFPTKSPSLDGLPALFYQNYWAIVGPKLVEAC